MNRYFLLSEKTLANAGFSKPSTLSVKPSPYVDKSSGSSSNSFSQQNYELSKIGDTENIPALPFFTSRSPLQSLRAELEVLNDNPTLEDSKRWNQYKQIFDKHFKYSNVGGISTGGVPSVYSIPSTPAGLAKQLAPSVFSEVDHRLFYNVFPDVPIQDVERIVNSIISTLPKSLQNKGQNLLLYLSSHPLFQNNYYSWSVAGELQIEGDLVPGSNVVDLIHYAVRSRPSIIAPLGWDAFLKLLVETNAPLEFLKKNFIFPPLAAASGGVKRKPLGSGSAQSSATAATAVVQQDDDELRAHPIPQAVVPSPTKVRRVQLPMATRPSLKKRQKASFSQQHTQRQKLLMNLGKKRGTDFIKSDEEESIPWEARK